MTEAYSYVVSSYIDLRIVEYYGLRVRFLRLVWNLVSLGQSKSCRSEPIRNLVRFLVSSVFTIFYQIIGFQLNFLFKLNIIRIFLVKFG